jgi:hypothetical protein
MNPRPVANFVNKIAIYTQPPQEIKENSHISSIKSAATFGNNSC